MGTNPATRVPWKISPCICARSVLPDANQFVIPADSGKVYGWLRLLLETPYCTCRNVSCGLLALHRPPLAPRRRWSPATPPYHGLHRPQLAGHVSTSALGSPVTDEPESRDIPLLPFRNRREPNTFLRLARPVGDLPSCLHFLRRR